VDVDAESVYEAAIRGVAALRKGGWVDKVGPGAQLEIEMRERSTRHVVSLGQLKRWCDGVLAAPLKKIRRMQLKRLLDG
jgi:hypothetical protein